MNKIMSCAQKGTELWMIMVSKIGRFTKTSMSSVSCVRFKGIRGHQSKSGKRTWGKEITGGVKYDGSVLYVYIDMSS